MGGYGELGDMQFITNQFEMKAFPKQMEDV